MCKLKKLTAPDAGRTGTGGSPRSGFSTYRWSSFPKAGQEELYRDVAPEPGVLGLVDDTHAAAAELGALEKRVRERRDFVRLALERAELEGYQQGYEEAKRRAVNLDVSRSPDLPPTG